MKKTGKLGELFPPCCLGYTNPELTAFVILWGRLHRIRKDLQDATKTEAEGGNGYAKKFWEWSEDQVREFS